jgi:hypothetical protein
MANQNTGKRLCLRGHPLSPQPDHPGWRLCRTCKSMRDRLGKRLASTRRRIEDADHVREIGRISFQKHAHAHRAGETARRQVRRAIERGLLSRPDHCQSCRTIVPRARDGRFLIQAHHYAGYENPLTVSWLCPICHKLAHDAAGGTP